MFTFENKVALITGAASGIGLACSKELLRRKLKAVAIVDISYENGTKALKEIIAEFKRNDCVIFLKSDITDQQQLNDAFEITVKTYKQLDIVINNAGIINERLWETCVAVNLNSTIRGSKLAIEKYFPKFKSGPEALIVNIASIAALIPSMGLYVPVYATTKAGVVGLTRTMGNSAFYKISNTRIIAICPGPTDTAILHFKEDQIPEPYNSLLPNSNEPISLQSPDDLAKIVLDIIPDAPSGSVWSATEEGCSMVEYSDHNLLEIQSVRL